MKWPHFIVLLCTLIIAIGVGFMLGYLFGVAR